MSDPVTVTVRVETDVETLADRDASVRFDAFCIKRMGQECAKYDLPYDPAQLTIERLKTDRSGDFGAVPVILRLVVDPGNAATAQFMMATLRETLGIPQPELEPL